ncbi:MULTISPECIES: ParA family protein [Streptomyces]|uniref:ParA family protein n=2 Tax=Streptomyces TaxID=1883 RepID=A0ABU4KDL7_9ACTN|nr:ParA family protein [Streptomyces roseolus]MDX2295880.1 ParA family protein [Streptomyces roseolus]
MAKVHVVMNRKGGVGKSLISLNMGAVCADVRGSRPDGGAFVAVASADPQGTALWRAARLAELPFDILDVSDDVENIGHLKALPYAHIFVDTPGWAEIDPESGKDPLGSDRYGRILRALLEQADDVIVPMLTEPDCYEPTWQTIEWVLKPLGVPFQVVINNWPPAEGVAYVDGTRGWCERHGYPVAQTVIRRYRVHTNATKVVTQYNANRVELQAREDFYRYALEHGLRGAEVGLPAQAAPGAGVVGA